MATGFLIIPLLDLHPGVVENSFFGVGFILAGIGTFLCVYMFGIFRAYRALFRQAKAQQDPAAQQDPIRPLVIHRQPGRFHHGPVLPPLPQLQGVHMFGIFRAYRALFEF